MNDEEYLEIKYRIRFKRPEITSNLSSSARRPLESSSTEDISDVVRQSRDSAEIKSGDTSSKRKKANSSQFSKSSTFTSSTSAGDSSYDEDDKCKQLLKRTKEFIERIGKKYIFPSRTLLSRSTANESSWFSARSSPQSAEIGSKNRSVDRRVSPFPIATKEQDQRGRIDRSFKKAKESESEQTVSGETPLATTSSLVTAEELTETRSLTDISSGAGFEEGDTFRRKRVANAPIADTPLDWMLKYAEANKHKPLENVAETPLDWADRFSPPAATPLDWMTKPPYAGISESSTKETGKMGSKRLRKGRRSRRQSLNQRRSIKIEPQQAGPLLRGEVPVTKRDIPIPKLEKLMQRKTNQGNATSSNESTMSTQQAVSSETLPTNTMPTEVPSTAGKSKLMNESGADVGGKASGSSKTSEINVTGSSVSSTSSTATSHQASANFTTTGTTSATASSTVGNQASGDKTASNMQKLDGEKATTNKAEKINQDEGNQGSKNSKL